MRATTTNARGGKEEPGKEGRRKGRVEDQGSGEGGESLFVAFHRHFDQRPRISFQTWRGGGLGLGGRGECEGR